jgi:hypothetical protein
MAIATKLKENWKEDKAILHNTISSLKQSMTDFKSERKTEWKSFKTKFNDDMVKVEQSFKKLTALRKK